MRTLLANYLVLLILTGVSFVLAYPLVRLSGWSQRTWFTLLLAANTLDIVSTLCWVAKAGDGGASEMNPLILVVMGTLGFVPSVILSKLLATTMLLAYVYFYRSQGDRKYQLYATAGFTVGVLFAVASNTHYILFG